MLSEIFLMARQKKLWPEGSWVNAYKYVICLQKAEESRNFQLIARLVFFAFSRGTSILLLYPSLTTKTINSENVLIRHL